MGVIQSSITVRIRLVPIHCVDVGITEVGAIAKGIHQKNTSDVVGDVALFFDIALPNEGMVAIR